MGVGGDQSRKRRGDERSSRRAALNQNVRDEIKFTGLEILLTQTHGRARAHKLYTLYNNTMGLVFIFACDYPNHPRTSPVNSANSF